MTARDSTPDDDEAITYEQWGTAFFADAVSEERILEAVNTITGQPIDFGPMGVGPGRIAKVRAYGEIGAATATRASGDDIGYRVMIPVSLTFEVDLQVETHRFEADLLVPLTLTAVACTGVRIWIAANAPRPEEVQVKVEAQGLRASLLKRVVGIETEVRRFVAGYVRRELDKPHVRHARMIEVSHAIDRAWASLAPARRPEGATGGVTADLNSELEREIRHNEQTFVDEPEGR